MTEGKTVKKTRGSLLGEVSSICMLGLTLVFGLLLSGEVSEYVKEGMRLAVGCVIPSSFPFMIISDIYVAYGSPENLRLLGMIFSRAFGISESGLGAFICGNVGGFPIGAKMCADAYASGALDKREAERLIPLSNNPSCAFVIGGVGIGMWGDIRVGFVLLISVYLATVICGVVTRDKLNKNDFIYNNVRQNYSLVESVKKSGSSSVSIISFICLFSVACGVIKKRIKNAFLLYPIYSILEVTNAVKILSVSSDFSPVLRLSICAFALGFGGISVGMQSSFFVSQAGLKMKNYYLVKLLEGLLAGSISSLIYQI